MSLLSRLFGHRVGSDYAKGIALYEEGRFAEAIDLLRKALHDEQHSPAESLTAFHLRQALVHEGRRLLRAGEPAAAGPLLDEAAEQWPDFPDLQFYSGAAAGMSSDWDAALAAAHRALRNNPDYCEARLLEACSFWHLERAPEAAASLNKLLETGRRIEHPLIDALARPESYRPDDLPTDLDEQLSWAAGGNVKEGQMSAAVALCRSGRWREGITQLKGLVSARPRYPDYRVKLAAALFQVGQTEEALDEAEEALRLNPRYRTAAYLRALILADMHRLEDARAMICEAADLYGSPHKHEELFAAYLRGVLAFLTGRLDEAAGSLQRWSDLTRTFPRGQLLRVAVADLTGHDVLVGKQLADLVDAWPGDAEYHHVHLCHLLRYKGFDELEHGLAEWPAPRAGESDERPLHLASCLALARARVPDLPPPDTAAPSPAWRLLTARGHALARRWERAWRQVSELHAEGYATEALCALQAEIAAQLIDSDLVPIDWRPPDVLPDIAVPPTVFLLHKRGDSESAEQEVRRRRRLQPEQLTWTWLSAEFWLDPVRRWIS